MNNSWNRIPIAIIDFEGDSRSGVVEFGVVRLLCGQIVGTHTRLCRSEEPGIAPQAFLLHGIRARDTTDCDPFAAEWGYFRDLRRGAVFAAHHAVVEQNLLRRQWPYPGQVPDWVRPRASVVEWGPWLDTKALYEATYPGLQSFALEDLVGFFQLQERLDQAAAEFCPRRRRRFHCALYDALASAMLLLRLAEQKEFAELTIEWLLEFSNAGTQARQRARQQNLALD